jgi:FKBP-type peptidyl-prolyl cis-trans isomerase 2
MLNMIEDGKKIRIHYTLEVDGEIVDSTDDREPFEFTQGKQQIIPGLEKQLEGLSVGDEREIIVGPDDAYGVEDPNAYIEVARTKMPDGELEVGMLVHATTPDGKQMVVRVAEIKEETIVLNFNHPLAGKELHFKIVIIEILD